MATTIVKNLKIFSPTKKALFKVAGIILKLDPILFMYI